MSCPPNINPLEWAARQLTAGGDLRVAAACLDKAPETGQKHYLRGGVALLRNDPLLAIAQFREAVRIEPTHADAHFELGNALYGQHDMPAAERAFQAALGAEPHRPLCYLNLGNVYVEQRKPTRAERHYRLALTLAPAASWDACAASNGLSNLLEQEGTRLDEARHVAAAALSGSSRCHYAAHNLGRLERRAGRTADAVNFARQAHVAEPRQHEYLVGLAAALHSASRLREACHHYRSAIQRNPADPRLTLDLANALQQDALYAEAIDAYAAALPGQLAQAAATLPASGGDTPGVSSSSGSSSSRGGSSSGGPRRGTLGRIVIYCRIRAHAGAESVREDVWGPTTLATKGVGGSEEAVIMVAGELARRGWAVAVYANPPAEDCRGATPVGELGGSVEWHEWYALPRIEGRGEGVAVLVSWRNLEGASLLKAASSRYVWLQDIVEHPPAYHEALLRRLDGILVLSAFHRRGLPEIAISKAVHGAATRLCSWRTSWRRWRTTPPRSCRSSRACCRQATVSTSSRPRSTAPSPR